MKSIRLPLSEIEVIAVTRVALGVGLGLLVAGHMSARRRQTIGWLLVMLGGISTLPLRADVLGRERLWRDN